MSEKSCLVSSKVLWSGLLQAKVELYHLAGDQYEVYTTKGGSVPVRRVGSLVQMICYGESFISNCKEQGFEEQFSTQTDYWHA